MSWTPPWRSRPSWVFFVAMTAIDAPIRPRTSRRTMMERRLTDTTTKPSPVLLRRREDQQQAAVLVVGGEQIGDRLGGDVALRVHGHRLAELADAPLQDGAHR